MSTRDEVLRLIEEDVTNLRQVDRKWVRDKEFMREVLQYRPQCLKYCSHEIVNDREIVEMVVSRNGHFLKFASHQLRSDPELVEMACMDNIAAMEYSLVPWNTLQEKNIVIKYFIQKRKSKHNPYDGIATVPSKFCEDFDVMFEAVSTFGNSLGYAKGDLVNNYELIFKAVQTNPSSVRHVPTYLLFEKDFRDQLIRANPKVYIHLPELFKNDFVIPSLNLQEDDIVISPVATIPLTPLVNQNTQSVSINNDTTNNLVTSPTSDVSSVSASNAFNHAGSVVTLESNTSFISSNSNNSSNSSNNEGNNQSTNKRRERSERTDKIWLKILEIIQSD